MEDKIAEIWQGDHLNRQEDAGFLYAYLIQRNNAAVDAGEKGTSINVSAPWGAGKTFFLTRFAKELRTRGYRVAEVNTWRDDHAEDPIYAIMSAILAGLGKSGKKSRLREALKKNAGKIAVRTGRGLLKKGLSLVIDKEEVEGIGDDIVKAIAGAGEETISEYADKALERFEDGQKAIDDFRAEIAKEVHNKEPLFVLVDELDRCRPTYAVSVLERAKHLFDVPNVIFVFATNADQLSHTIRSVYGAGFDAERYLHRFFDRTYQFDEPSTLGYIHARWEALGFRDERFLNIWNSPHQNFIAKISAAKGLTLRDIDQCMEILWSVSEFADQRVPVPLLYLYSLIVAYHLHATAAFEEAAGEGTQPGRGGFKAFQEFFDQSVIHERPTVDRMTGRHAVSKTMLVDIMTDFKRIIERGITEAIEGESTHTRYAEQYRSTELSKLHNNTWRGDRVDTILQSYGKMIRSAGRVSAASQPA